MGIGQSTGVKENRKAPAAVGRPTELGRRRPGLGSIVTVDLAWRWVGVGNRGTALRPLLLSLVPGVKASLAAQHPLP